MKRLRMAIAVLALVGSMNVQASYGWIPHAIVRLAEPFNIWFPPRYRRCYDNWRTVVCPDSPE